MTLTRDVPPLHADRVYRFYRSGDEETLAVQGVSLTLEAGELVALCGPSGSGKSTLLACLAGTDEPSGGTVWVSGRRMSGRTEAERARLRAEHVGVLSQSDNLIEHLTVLGNLRLARGLGQGHADLHHLLDDLAIEERGLAWPDQLSGGELVRAGLAVALVNSPAVLLADEPTGELDAASEERLLGVLRRRADDGCGVLVASHSDAVAREADRTLFLRDGRLQ